MPRHEGGIDPPGELSDSLVRELEQSDDYQLRAIIHYAQALLHRRHDPTTALEARDGEEILRINDHGAYTIVIVKRTDVTGPDQGPFAYRVKFEPGVGDDAGNFRWYYLGRVEE